MIDNELKVCPFCGGKAWIEVLESHTHSSLVKNFMPDFTSQAFLHCAGCNVGMSEDTEELLIKRWNSREYL